MLQATKTVWSRGGVAGFYQGLIPWVRASVFILGLKAKIFSWLMTVGVD
jgi:hypothetical protein